MGGCVTRGVASSSGAAPLRRRDLPPKSYDSSPVGAEQAGPGSSEEEGTPTGLAARLLGEVSTPPSDSLAGAASDQSSTNNGVPVEALRFRNRRRLSLSRSEPAAAANNEARGQLHLHQHAFAANSSSSGGYSDPSDDDQSSAPETSLAAARPRQCRRLSVSGMPATIKQDNFENKRQEIKSDTGSFDANMLLSLGIGYACEEASIVLRRHGVAFRLGDNFLMLFVVSTTPSSSSSSKKKKNVCSIDGWGLYGVFDGHGPYGHDVSNFVQRELPKLIYNDPNFLSDPAAALRNSFLTVHQMLELAASTHNLFDCSLSGSTATVVLHRKTCNKLFIAHVGDSRCVLGRINKSGDKIEHVDLTTDHKPNADSEKKRIVAAGGQVRRLEGDIPYRVFVKGRLYPGLAMSRAIGDFMGEQAGVICEPDVTEYTVNPERDLFIALCSDGVWEFISSAEVANVIHINSLRGVQNAAEVLAKESWNRWIQEEGNVVDDITCEVVYLNPEHPIHQVFTHDNRKE